MTDHKALIFLMNTPFTTARLTRWSLALQEFTFKIEHCRGVDNAVADFFSRNFSRENIHVNSDNYLLWNVANSIPRTENIRCIYVDEPIICQLSMRSELLDQLRNLSELQKADVKIPKVRENPSLQMKVENEILHCKMNYDNKWDL